MTDDVTRILALEARLDDVQRTLMAHDLLTRALLAQLALADPDRFRQLTTSLTGLKMFREGGGGGELPSEVSQEINDILGEIVRSIERRG